MPYPNEHAARIKNPDLYEEFARENDKFGQGIHVIYGIRVRDGKRVSELQAIRFDKKKFTVAQAKKWLSDHDHKLLEFEPAGDEEKQTAKFRNFTYNGVKVQATNRRSSDRDDKAWMRTVRQGDSERVVHYADPDMPMRRNNPQARANFMARHNCGEKKDPFAPGFWACYDWSKPSEKEGKDMSETDKGKMVYGYSEEPEIMVASVAPLGGATSFAEYEAMVEADEIADQIGTMAYQFREIVANIMASSDIEDKASAVADLASEFSTRMGQATKEVESEESTEDKAVWTTKYINDLPDGNFLYIESGGKKDDENKTVPRGLRHFPYKDASGKVDLPHLRNAIQRIPQSNASGLTAAKKRQLQERARDMLAREQKEMDSESLIERIVDKVKGLFIKEEKPQPASNFMVWKEADGTYRWLARYSNNFRDNDNPPEIIAKESHIRFVEMVDKGEVEYPELWLWHVPEWKWGKANWVAWDDGQDGTGFALAGGTVDKGCEWLAEAVDSVDPANVLVSHGMPMAQMERSEDDPTIITRHITKEISPLLARAAANKITSFEILKEKETDMIPEAKRDALVGEWGLDPKKLAQLEALNAQTASDAKEAGLEFKEETETETTEAQVENTEVATEAPDEQETKVNYATREEVAEVLVQTHTPLFEAVQSLSEQVAALAEQVKALKQTDEEKVAEKVSLTPAASILDIFKMRAVGSPEAKVDGRTELGKAKPKETEPVKPRVHPIPFINDMLLGTPNRNND